MIIVQPFNDPDPILPLQSIGVRLHDFTKFAITENLDIHLFVFGYGDRVALVVKDLPGMPFSLDHYHRLARAVIRHVPEVQRSWSKVGLLVMAMGIVSSTNDEAPNDPVVLEPVVGVSQDTPEVFTITLPKENPTRGVARKLHFINHGKVPAEHLVRVTGDSIFKEGSL